MASIGNAFQVNFSQVQDTCAKFVQQRTVTEQSQSIVKSFGPKIISSWIGGDSDEFNQDIVRKLMPKYTELALAFAGVDVNLRQAMDIVSMADKAASGVAGKFADVCQKIMR